MNTYEQDPWMVPVPVKTSSFVSLHDEHADLNIEVDLGKWQAFGFPRDPISPDHVLYADLQTNADVNALRRLGSGRSGFYRGKYLKGIGRTPLAANWSDPSDSYHNSGHMLPSSALREYLISHYFKVKGKVELINPCDGLLLSPLLPALKGYLDAVFPKGEQKSHAGFATVDAHLQAVSIKPGTFARFSNFVWSLDHILLLEQSSAIGLFFKRLAACLSGPTKDPLSDDDLDPGTIVRLLSEGITRAITNFGAYTELGVYWGSFHNNFTLDGRFLDLELPLFFGFPFFGRVVKEPTSACDAAALADYLPVGCEAFTYIQQARIFVNYLRERLKFLARESKVLGSIERIFMREVTHELRRTFSKEHLLFAKAKIIETVSNANINALRVSGKTAERLRHLVASKYGNYFESSERIDDSFEYKKLPQRFARMEPSFEPIAFYPDFLDDAILARVKEADTFNSLITELEGLTETFDIFYGIRRAENTIRMTYGDA